MSHRYHKIEASGMVYYISEWVMSLAPLPDKRPATLMLFSDMVVNTRTNEMVKCKYPPETLIDNWVEVVYK